MKLIIFLYSIIIYLLSSFMVAESKIYTWVDENGKSYFSDNDLPGTKEVVLKEINLVSNNQKVQEAPIPSKKTSPVIENKKNIIYQMSISSPENNVAIRANNGNFSVNVAISPALEDNHKIQLYIDNLKFGEPQSLTAILAENVDRGSHTIQVFLIDSKEVVRAKTNIITVHVQRASSHPTALKLR